MTVITTHQRLNICIKYISIFNLCRTRNMTGRTGNDWMSERRRDGFLMDR